MKRSLRKLLWLVSGILLIFAGIIAIFHPQSAVLSVSFVLGVALLFSGIFSAIIFLTAEGTAFGSAWVLAGGLFDIILACMMLGNPYLVEENLPFLFGMWIMFSGVIRAVFAWELKRAGARRWGWMVAAGTLCVIVGFLSFYDPLVVNIAAGVLVGVFLILQGLVSLALWGYASSMEK